MSMSHKFTVAHRRACRAGIYAEVAAAECLDAVDLGLTDEDGMALLRDFILSYGLLLRESPAIYGCAQTLGMHLVRTFET
jgi:hypothetical protein